MPPARALTMMTLVAHPARRTVRRLVGTSPATPSATNPPRRADDGDDDFRAASLLLLFDLPPPAYTHPVLSAHVDKVKSVLATSELTIENDESDVAESIKMESAAYSTQHRTSAAAAAAAGSRRRSSSNAASASWDEEVRGSRQAEEADRRSLSGQSARAKTTTSANGLRRTFSSSKTQDETSSSKSGEEDENAAHKPRVATLGSARVAENPVRDNPYRVPSREAIVRKRRMYDDEVDESDVVEESKARLGKLGSGDVEDMDAIVRGEVRAEAKPAKSTKPSSGAGEGDKSSSSSSTSEGVDTKKGPIPPPWEQSSG